MNLDYSKGFGGKYGVLEDKKDKSAVGFDHVEKLAKHSSQTGMWKLKIFKLNYSIKILLNKKITFLDYAKGFGGKFGIENDKRDRSASNFNESSEPVGTNYKPVKPEIKADIKSIKNRFENCNPSEEAKKKAEEIRQERLNKEKMEKEFEQVYVCLLKKLLKYFDFSGLE